MPHPGSRSGSRTPPATSLSGTRLPTRLMDGGRFDESARVVGRCLERPGLSSRTRTVLAAHRLSSLGPGGPSCRSALGAGSVPRRRPVVGGARLPARCHRVRTAGACTPRPLAAGGGGRPARMRRRRREPHPAWNPRRYPDRAWAGSKRERLLRKVYDESDADIDEAIVVAYLAAACKRWGYTPRGGPSRNGHGASTAWPGRAACSTTSFRRRAEPTTPGPAGSMPFPSGGAIR